MALIQTVCLQVHEKRMNEGRTIHENIALLLQTVGIQGYNLIAARPTAATGMTTDRGFPALAVGGTVVFVLKWKQRPSAPRSRPRFA
jgi:hypothetical protein